MAAPNFSGQWTLNLSKSSYGSFPAPQGMTRKINHQGVALSISSTQRGAQGDVTSDLLYTTDGHECLNKMLTGEVKGTARFEGDSLIIESSRQINNAELKERDVWTLSSDGKTLTITAHVTLPQQGSFDIKQVFDKQP